jgi:hypothetical protein
VTLGQHHPPARVEAQIGDAVAARSNFRRVPNSFGGTRLETLLVRH